MPSREILELSQQLGQIIPLDPESCNQMIEYGLNLKDETEISDHFLNMLGESDATLAFLENFLKHKQSISSIKASQKEVPMSRQETKAKEETKTKINTKHGTTTSKLLKTKQLASPKENRKTKKKNLDNLKDLELLINSLEINGSSSGTTVCYCNATRHPLFELAPNCLNCGKIICAKEGLQPCSFCGHDLLTSKERAEIRHVLVQEKITLENKSSSENSIPKPKLKPKKMVISMNAGENLWKAQDKAFEQAEQDWKAQQQQRESAQKQIEELQQQQNELDYYNQVGGGNSELIAAQQRLKALLEFQDNGTERTKIIDNAADYELTNNSGNMWLSATERALRLKKQQRQLKKYKELEKQRLGKDNKVVEMVIKDGKVKMVEKVHDVSAKDDDEIQEIETQLKQEKKQREGEMLQTVWDYESDQQRWEKPIYIERKLKDGKQEKIDQHRVQFQQGDETEMVINIY